ncbi:ATP synthase delta/epsilon chain alpha-helix domain-containing protein, partial [Thermodesulfobacteriota bacterium]
FLSGIVPGELRYNAGDAKDYVMVTNGFSEVSNDKVSILVDAAEKAVEIDMERAKLAIERARERLARERETEDVDFLRAEASLRRAIERLKLAEKSI